MSRKMPVLGLDPRAKPAFPIKAMHNRGIWGAAMKTMAIRKPACLLLCLLATAPAAAKDTGLIFVSNEKTNNIVVIDPASFKIVKDIKTCRRPRDLHFSTDHAKLYVACGDDDVIQILDVAKLTVIGKIKTGPSPEAFGIDEQRGRLYVSEEEASALAVIDMTSDRVVQEVPTGAEP